MEAEWPNDGLDERLESLARRVSGFLEKIRKVIDTDSIRYVVPPEAPWSSLSLTNIYSNSIDPSVNLRNGPDQSKHIICSPHHTVFANALVPPKSSLFFESQQILAKYMIITCVVACD